MKYTLCFQHASWAKRWNMTTKIVENEAGSSQVDQFAVVTARPRLGTWLVVTSRVEGTRHVCCLVSKECRIKAKEKRLRCSFILNYVQRWAKIDCQADAWDKFCKIKNFAPSFREVTIDHVLSLGRAVTTANWSTWEVPHHFPLFVQLAVLKTECPRLWLLYPISVQLCPTENTWIWSVF